ncbi:LytTR family transcriptional regulator [Maribellus luteus]|uniref:LytTR family transcriptional regulator n=1 Tax=Maribellus luteus TaxID=2305463 RepID=A0A399T3X9_9BACT|nr:LytTR family DNA-binding domain-containing protein [Maribellus luteus]RIJ48891.1 LytTR family transcriptional regulator [Maribellus luteus]
MNTLIAGFIGPQEIVIIIFIGFILLPVFILYKVVKNARNKKNENTRWSGEEVEKQFRKFSEDSFVKKNVREYFPVKEGNKITLIQFSEIVDFSVINNYVFLTDINGKDYLVDSSLSALELKLPDDFIRVHKSTIINSKLIGEVKKLDNGRYDLVMKCEKERVISCSKSYNEKIKSIIDF